MKKIINAPERVVEDMLRGMELAHGGLIRVIPESNVVVRADAPVEGKVALVSGGGSGHEPTHGGFVGPGMLDAACAGAVFTSPPPDQIVDEMLEKVLGDSVDFSGSEVAVMVNGMGGTPLMELYIAYAHVAD